MGVCSSHSSSNSVTSQRQQVAKISGKPSLTSPNLSAKQLKTSNPHPLPSSSPPPNRISVDDIDSPATSPDINNKLSSPAPFSLQPGVSSIEATVVVQPHHDVDSLYLHSHPTSVLSFPNSSFEIRLQFIHANELRTFEVSQLDSQMKVHQFKSRVLAAHRQELNELNANEYDQKKLKVLLIHRNSIMNENNILANYNITPNTCDQESVLLLFSRSPPFNPDLKIW